MGVIAEDSTLTVINGANANLSGSYDATGEHSGDVIDTSSSSHTAVSYTHLTLPTNREV